ncbi:DUF4238 domain-containing protein [Streptacidiphilus sp. PAMC 29251]
MNTPSLQDPKADAEWQARIEARRTETAPPVKNQHVVSQVLLKRFAVDDGQGHRVQQFNLDQPDRHHQLKAIKSCGMVRDFVPFASASLEAVWGQVENLLPVAAAAAVRGDVFDDDRHVEVLKDFIALHWIRSRYYRDHYRRIVTDSLAKIRSKLLTEKADALRKETFRRTGRHPIGPGGLLAAADELLQLHLDDYSYSNGADLRVRIEENFEQARKIIRGSGLRILSPETGEYLLGDVPAMTFEDLGDKIQHRMMALGDSGAVVLPLDPKHLLVGRSPHDEIATLPTRTVSRLNAMQIEVAVQHVYLRPRSGLEPIVKAYLALGGRSDSTRSTDSPPVTGRTGTPTAEADRGRRSPRP